MNGVIEATQARGSDCNKKDDEHLGPSRTKTTIVTAMHRAPPDYELSE
jgi:hypothetical protein